ncbi:heptaprenyl diphosphate synthase component 1 [Alkalibacillus salilacus]|uniref:Heptaprenyl diphosphate synthase n=1 Tax=Alkalibacillus salilacus TaxID=284582 RepID=A0ABT9VCF4_9BACI|nr:heptaprenyl diphosphate synthase component 1 [Alkalibacillus salilacus]MDQ0158490.1 hypothetical protein [Alkalibacillus salilacus]
MTDYNDQALISFQHSFLGRYKHDYIELTMYDSFFATPLLLFLYDVTTRHHNVLADALVNMQLSLNIHDQLDHHFDEDIEVEQLKSNQLHVLMGDYHSAFFYKLLSTHHETNMLHFFLTYIKEINEYKIELLHHDHSIEERLNKVTNVYSCLLQGVIQYFNLESEYDNLFIEQFVLQHAEALPLYWMNSSSEEMRHAIQSRLKVSDSENNTYI